MEHERESMSDEALVEAVKQGDRHAGENLYHRHVDRVHRICYRIVLDRSQVVDCVQEVWVKVFRRIHRIENGRSFEPWLNRVAANTAIDHYRKHHVQRQHRVYGEDVIETCSCQSPSHEQTLDNALLQQRIQNALLCVGVRQRTAFVLRYLEDMPPAEIAAILGCRTGTVRTHIQRCLVTLRQKLASEADLWEF